MGTSVAIRIIVADKGSGGRRPPEKINRASVRSLRESMREVPPRAVIQPAPLPPPPGAAKPASLFGAFRAVPAKSFPRAARPLPSFAIATVDYRVHDPVAAAHDDAALSSEERRVGQGCVRQCRSRWSPYH